MMLVEENGRGKTALSSINTCIARVPNIKVKVLEQIYNSLIESRMMTRVEIWGLEGRWKEIEKVHDMFCKWSVCKRIGKNK